jgi:hypothetical protein
MKTVCVEPGIFIKYGACAIIDYKGIKVFLQRLSALPYPVYVEKNT